MATRGTSPSRTGHRQRHVRIPRCGFPFSGGRPEADRAGQGTGDENFVGNSCELHHAATAIGRDPENAPQSGRLGIGRSSASGGRPQQPSGRVTIGGWGAIVGLSVLWGGAYFTAKVAIAEISVAWIVAMRFFLAAAALWILLRI